MKKPIPIQAGVCYYCDGYSSNNIQAGVYYYCDKYSSNNKCSFVCENHIDSFPDFPNLEIYYGWNDSNGDLIPPRFESMQISWGKNIFNMLELVLYTAHGLDNNDTYKLSFRINYQNAIELKPEILDNSLETILNKVKGYLPFL